MELDGFVRRSISQMMRNSPSRFARTSDGTIDLRECFSVVIRVIGGDRKSFRLTTSSAMRHPETIVAVGVK
jgi:hypothetical protein